MSGGARSARTTGVVYAFLAYGSWGLLPAYWKALQTVPVAEVLAHRVLWSSLFAALLVSVAREWPAVRSAVRTRRVAITLLASSALIGINWLLFIYTVNRGDVLAASLGYFLNPLVNVALGRAVLGERLRPVQAGAVAIAAAGVLQLTVSAGQLPWISLALAASFGAYGLLRKVAPLHPLVSLVVETVSLAPVALGYLVWSAGTGHARAPSSSAGVQALLALSGVVTALPLVWFASAAGRLRLTTLGLFQYLAPTGHFALAVLAYGEPFAPAQALAFGCIWAGLLLYSGDTLRSARARKGG